jgi:hypothetical protein
MPGFGDNPNTLDDQVDGMYSEEMLQAVALYEANLHNDGQGNDLPGNEVDANHTFDEATTTSTSSTTSTTEKG